MGQELESDTTFLQNGASIITKQDKFLFLKGETKDITMRGKLFIIKWAIAITEWGGFSMKQGKNY